MPTPTAVPSATPAALRARVDAWPPALSFAFTLLLLLVIYVPTATYDSAQSPDGVAVAIPAWQFAAHGNFTLDAFEGDLIWFIDNGERIVSNRQPGAIFFAIPFYWLLGADPATPTLAPAGLAAALAAALAMAILHLGFRRFVSPSAAMAAALVAGLATSTWSVSADALWTHGPNQLWLATALLLLAAERYAASGVAFGLAVLTRPHTAVIAAVCGLWHSARKRSLRPAAAIGLTSSLGLVALLAYNRVVVGTAAPTGAYGSYPTDNLAGMGVARFAENLLGTLVSPDRGILVMSPFLLLLVPGLRAGWRAAPPWVRSAALAGVVYMLVQLRVNYFSGGDNFYSYRLPIEMLTMAAPLLLLAYREWTAKGAARRRAFFALVAVSVAVQALGAVFHRPTYDMRSAWANFKLWETLQGTHPVVLLFLLVAVGCGLVVAGILARGGTAAPVTDAAVKR